MFNGIHYIYKVYLVVQILLFLIVHHPTEMLCHHYSCHQTAWWPCSSHTLSEETHSICHILASYFTSNSRFNHNATYVRNSFIFMTEWNSIMPHTTFCLSIHLWIGRWVACFLFLWIIPRWIVESKRLLSVLWVIEKGMEFQSPVGLRMDLTRRTQSALDRIAEGRQSGRLWYGRTTSWGTELLCGRMLEKTRE